MVKKLFAASLLSLCCNIQCATSEEKPDSHGKADGSKEEPQGETESDSDATNDEDEDEDEDDISSTWPAAWEDIPLRYEFTCPTAPFKLGEPKKLDLKGQSFLALGSTLELQDNKSTDSIHIGVVGALKDASRQTRKNLKRAIRIFKKKKVSFILANGDLAEDDEIDDVLMMLGEESPLPVFAFPGNIEWAGAFNHAVEKVQKSHPHVINMNWIRHVDFGRHHLFSVPGYHNTRFMRSGACRYTQNNLDEIAPIVKQAQADGDIVILSSHGPPLSKGDSGIDVAEGAGNVGNPALTDFIEMHDIRYGIFSHILEAGGRATADLKSGQPLRLPTKKKSEKLFINVGSASSFAWTMLNGKVSNGMAAVVSVYEDGAKASIYRF
jgi:Icc-related predicted phosphoesterase